MKAIQRLFASSFARRRPAREQVVVLVFRGISAADVETHLQAGLFHNLAQVADQGARADLSTVTLRPLDALSGELRRHQLRVELLTPLEPRVCDLEAICEVDIRQQQRLYDCLLKSQSSVVVAEFDMAERICAGIAAGEIPIYPDLLRDVAARMDEIVGKALPLIDPVGTLVVATLASSPETLSNERALLFSSRSFLENDRPLNIAATVWSACRALTNAE